VSRPAQSRDVTIRSFAYWDSAVPYGQDLARQDLARLVRLVTAGRLHPATPSSHNRNIGVFAVRDG
jgi:hypothetical protein